MLGIVDEVELIDIDDTGDFIIENDIEDEIETEIEIIQGDELDDPDLVDDLDDDEDDLSDDIDLDDDDI